VPRTFSADSEAPVSEAWSLVSEPSRWPEWSPHVRGAWGLGAPEVREGAFGLARLLWVVPVPARIVDKQDGRAWTWRVGPMTLVHTVTPRDSGSRVSTTLSAPGPLEPALAATYGPIVQRLMERLARVAERGLS
jgi:hypothetical protein